MSLPEAKLSDQRLKPVADALVRSLVAAAEKAAAHYADPAHYPLDDLPVDSLERIFLARLKKLPEVNRELTTQKALSHLQAKPKGRVKIIPKGGHTPAVSETKSLSLQILTPELVKTLSGVIESEPAPVTQVMSGDWPLPDAVVPLFRFIYHQRGVNYYSTDVENPASFIRDVICCYVYGEEEIGTVPLYHFYHGPNFDHYYNTDRTVPAGFSFQGITCYIYPEQAPGTVPLYRYYSPSGSDHYLSTDSVAPQNYNPDGIAGYVYPVPHGWAAPPIAEVSKPVNVLQFCINRVVCNLETGDAGSHEEILLKGVAVSPTGQVVPLSKIRLSMEEKEIYEYSPPLALWTFNILDGGDQWPKSYYVNLACGEEDHGGFNDFTNQLYNRLQTELLKVGPEAGAIAGGVIGGPLGAIAGAVLAELINYAITETMKGIKDWWSDEILGIAPISFSVGSPTAGDGDQSFGPYTLGFSREAAAELWGGNYTVEYSWRLYAMPISDSQAVDPVQRGRTDPQIVRYYVGDKVRIFAFQATKTGQLGIHYWDGSQWKRTNHDQAMGSVSIVTAPGVVTYEKKIYAFVCGGDGNLYVRKRNAQGKWTWANQGHPLNAQVNSTPAVISYETQDVSRRLYAFVTGSEGHLYVNYWDGAQWRWADQGHPTGKKVGGSPGVIAYFEGGTIRIYVFVTGAGGHLYVCYWDGGQWVWADLGRPAASSLASSPEALVFVDNGVRKIFVFATGADGHLHDCTWNGSDWCWTDHGSPVRKQVSGVPAVAAYGVNGTYWPYVFVHGSNEHLYIRYWNGFEWRWSHRGAPQGTTVTRSYGEVSTKVNDIQRMYGFATGKNGRLYCHYWNGSEWRWADLGPTAALVKTGHTK